MSEPLSLEEQVVCLSRCIAHKEENFDAAMAVLLDRIDKVEDRVDALENKHD